MARYKHYDYNQHKLIPMLKGVFDIDMGQCPQCGGPLKIIAAIEDLPVIAKILAHLGLSARAPPRAFDPFQLA